MNQQSHHRQCFCFGVLLYAVLIWPTNWSQCIGLDPITFACEPADTERTVERDWKQFPAILHMSAPASIAAVGDVHGDFKRLMRLLAAAELIHDAPDSPRNVRWAGGRTTLVCTGDLIDKGDHSIVVIECFRELVRQAEAAGGHVVVTMGNHEAEFLADPDDDDKAEEFLRELRALDMDPRDVASGKDKLNIGEFLRSLPLAVKIDDWFFAHACNTMGMSLVTLDREIRDSVDRQGFGAEILVGRAGLLEARLHPRPWWERKYDTATESESRLRGYADALGIKHFVMGHQPGKTTFSDGSKRHAGEMVQKFDGLIFLIDVGMSEAIDHSKGALLKINRDHDRQTATRIDSHGVTETIWSQ